MYLYMYVYTFAAAEDKQKGPSFVLCIHSLYNNIFLLEAHTHKIDVLMSMQVYTVVVVVALITLNLQPFAMSSSRSWMLSLQESQSTGEGVRSYQLLGEWHTLPSSWSV